MTPDTAPTKAVSPKIASESLREIPKGSAKDLNMVSLKITIPLTPEN